MKKKFLSVLMCTTLLLGTIASATTIDGSTNKTGEVEGSGTVKPAIINVEIPTTLEFKVDPFNIEQKGKVTTSALTVENKSNVPVDVKMTALKGEAAGVTFLTDPAAVAKANDKSAFLWLGLVTPTITEGKITDVKPTTYSASKNLKQVVKGEALQDEISLGALVEAAYDENDNVTIHPTRGTMYLGIMGDVSTVTDWKADDTIKVTATFSVDPKVVGTVK